MKSIVRSAILVALCLFLFTPETNASVNTNRIDGQNRFEVAVNVSKKGWSSAKTVVVTSSEAYADALAATPLAYLKNAPILLTHSTSLTNVTSKRIKELRASEVIIVGGPKSVSDSVIKSIKNLGISNVRRISGANRFEVAANIAKEMPSTNRAIVTYGHTFADALSIAPYAARNRIPILLTEKNSVPSSTRNIINSKGIKDTVVVGGENSVSAKVYNALPSAERIGGADRYEVAVNIIKKYNLSTSAPFMSNGSAFADALSGSVLAAKTNSPILLTVSSGIPGPTVSLMKEKGIKNITILGGTKSVTSAVTNRITAPLFGKRIVIDAGHGDQDSGAVGNGIQEKDVVLDVSKRLVNKLKNKDVVPYMTRSEDNFLELEERVEYAKSKNADAFISVHANSFTSTSANGTETYWNSMYAGSQSKSLATEIQSRLVTRLGTRDRGVKEANYYVIKNNKMPSVLVELAFISNSSDAKKLKDPSYRDKAAQAIYEGIDNYYK
ncbi:cell wall-binding repeat-containing protein [Metabacillus halosaccharovorans]|uniref:cell wall-binding repeat-containing protein n=1 Tax=Metabacillus halosaccharovorans TaxID=930124 RepID=UPI0034CE5368